MSKGHSDYHQTKKVVPIKEETKEKIFARRSDGETIDGYLNRLMDTEKQYNSITTILEEYDNALLKIVNKLESIERSMTNSLVLTVKNTVDNHSKFVDITGSMGVAQKNKSDIDETEISIEKPGLLVKQFEKNKEEVKDNESSFVGNSE